MIYRGYFFCSISWPQHLSEPVPALVTMTCEPHLPQMYILPSWFAIALSLLDYEPVKCGRRLFKKAWTPSLRSAVVCSKT